MKRMLLPLFVCTLCCTSAFSQQQPRERITEEFFYLYEQYPTKAYTQLFQHNRWMKGHQEVMNQNKIHLRELTQGLGKYMGYELLSEKSIGTSYVMKSFLVKYERQPVRFNFVLYNPGTRWQIQSLSWDKNLKLELKLAMNEEEAKKKEPSM